MEILNRIIKPGASVQVNLETARLHTRTRIEVPVIIERGMEDGPVLLLCGGIHGDEVNGIEIVRRAIVSGINKPDKGTVICVPILNVFGFLNLSREFPDGKDLNRFFPGTKTGSLANQFAYAFMEEVVPKIDYCLDFHTGGANRFNTPQIRISRNNADLLNLAHAFNPSFIVYARDKDKSFREAATKLGKKVLLFEGGKSLDINNRVTNKGVEGIMRIMQHIGMRDFSSEIVRLHTKDPILIEDSTWIRARHSGLFRSFVEDSTYVSKGEKIGTISDPYGEVEFYVKSTMNGFIIGINQAPIVIQGDAIYHIGFVKQHVTKGL